MGLSKNESHRQTNQQTNLGSKVPRRREGEEDETLFGGDKKKAENSVDIGFISAYTSWFGLKQDYRKDPVVGWETKRVEWTNDHDIDNKGTNTIQVEWVFLHIIWLVILWTSSLSLSSPSLFSCCHVQFWTFFSRCIFVWFWLHGKFGTFSLLFNHYEVVDLFSSPSDQHCIVHYT